MRVVIHGANNARVDVPARQKARDGACSCGGSRDAAPRARVVAGRGTHVYLHGYDALFTSHRDERSADAGARETWATEYSARLRKLNALKQQLPRFGATDPKLAAKITAAEAAVREHVAIQPDPLSTRSFGSRA